MVDVSHNILVLHDLARIRIHPIHNPKPLLHPLILQFLIKDVLKLRLIMQLPKDLVRRRGPRDEPSEGTPDLSFGVVEMSSHGHRDRPPSIQPYTQLVLP